MVNLIKNIFGFLGFCFGFFSFYCALCVFFCSESNDEIMINAILSLFFDKVSKFLCGIEETFKKISIGTYNLYDDDNKNK